MTPVLRACPRQGEQTQTHSSRGRGVAPPQDDGLPAAVMALKHGRSSNETAAASTEASGRAAASDPETSGDHRTGPPARACPTSAAGRPAGGPPARAALNLGYSSEEEKQDRTKDESGLESRQQGGCECELGSALMWPQLRPWADRRCRSDLFFSLPQLWSRWWTCSM